MSHPDTAITLDAADIGAGMHARDTSKWWPRVLVEKYDDEQAAWVARKAGVKLPKVNGDLLSRFLKPYDTAEAYGNLLTTAGLDRLTKLYIASGATQALTNTSGRIGVGNSATAAAIGQAGAQADQVADESTAPGAGVGAFSSPTTKGAGLTVGTINAGSCRAIWIRRTAANSAALDDDGVTVRVEGDTAA